MDSIPDYFGGPSPESFQDAQSQAASAGFYDAPSQVPSPPPFYTLGLFETLGGDPQDGPGGFYVYFDSQKEKTDFYWEQNHYIGKLENAHQEDLSKHLHMAWQIKRALRDGSSKRRKVDPDSDDELASDSSAGRAIRKGKGSRSDDEDDSSEDQLERKALSLSKRLKFMDKWTAWPLPPDKITELGTNEGPNYDLRDAIITTMVQLSKISLRKRGMEDSISTEDTATLWTYFPIVREIVQKFDHLLSTMYRARQGCLVLKPKSTRKATILEDKQSEGETEDADDEEMEEAENAAPEYSAPRRKPLNTMDALDVFNYCTLLGWPAEVLHNSAKRMAKILPNAGFETLGYYSVPEIPEFSADHARKWIKAPKKIPPIPLVDDSRSSLDIGGEKVHYNTLQSWKTIDSLRGPNIGDATGGVAPDRFLATIPGKRRRKWQTAAQNQRRERKERLERAWEEEHNGGFEEFDLATGLSRHPEI